MAREPRTPATPPDTVVVDEAPAAGAAAADTVQTDTGATVKAVGADPAAVAAAEAAAFAAGGPGAGAEQVARQVEGVETRPLATIDETTRRAELLRGGAGRDRLADGLVEHPSLLDAAGHPLRLAANAGVTKQPGINDILPLSGPTLDPSTVPGTKIATATAQVRHDGVTYKPGETFTIDFRAHSELVPIGAIVATPWHDLPDHVD